MQTTLITPLEQAINDAAAAQSQPRELRRVRETIGELIISYVESHLHCPFQMAHLQYFVTESMLREKNVTVQPSSVDRVLRDLRQRGAVEYVNVSRKGSLYRATAVDRSKLV